MANRKKTSRSHTKVARSAKEKGKYGVWRCLFSFLLGAVLTGTATFVFLKNKPIANYESSPTIYTDTQTKNSSIVSSEVGKRTVMQLLSLTDEELEKVDILELNLAVARETEGVRIPDYDHYRRIVDNWTEQFLQWLPVVEQEFYKNPARWENDINFARMGALAQWLDQAAGIAYIEDQKYLKEIQYKDLGHLLIHGLIDTKRGTCGNMPVLHVAMGRRCGWPVSLACVKSHFVCRYDDGNNVYNLETTDTGRGGFAMERDEGFIEEFKLSKRAISSGSDLRSLTARETLAIFIARRARYYRDTGQMDLADRDYSLARALFPNNRRIYMTAFEQMVFKGGKIFDGGEEGHPVSIMNYFNPRNTQRTFTAPVLPPGHTIEDVMRMNEMNRARTAGPPNPARPPVLPNSAKPKTVNPIKKIKK